MLLSDKDILLNIRNNNIKVHPFSTDMLQPASVDLSLDNKFRLFNKNINSIDPLVKQMNLTNLVKKKPEEPFVLNAKEFVLGSTYEKISIPNNIAARLEGKSSLARIGLSVHSTAGFIDPGFSGYITLELGNLSSVPIKLWYKLRISQICFFRLTSRVNKVYGSSIYKSKYQNQTGPTESKLHTEFT